MAEKGNGRKARQLTAFKGTTRSVAEATAALVGATEHLGEASTAFVGTQPVADVTSDIVGATQPVAKVTSAFVGATQPVAEVTSAFVGATQPVADVTSAVKGVMQHLGEVSATCVGFQPVVDVESGIVGATQHLGDTSAAFLGAMHPTADMAMDFVGATQFVAEDKAAFQGTMHPIAETTEQVDTMRTYAGVTAPATGYTSTQGKTVAEVKRYRATARGLLTRQIGTINKLTKDIRNFKQVKEKMTAFTNTVGVFERAHSDLLDLLKDEEHRVEAKEYRNDTMSRVVDFQVALDKWLVTQEENASYKETPDHLFTDEDHHLRLKETLDSCLEIENEAIGGEIGELSRLQELELQNRQLMIQREQRKYELEKAKLESEVLLARERNRLAAELKRLREEVSHTTNVECQKKDGYGPTTNPTNAENAPGHPEINGIYPQPQSTPYGIRKEPSRVPWEPSSIMTEGAAPENMTTILADALSQVLDMSKVNQLSLMESLQVPKGEIQPFSGDELEYWPFIRSFLDTVDCLSIPDAQKLACLRKHCTGKAALALKCTAYKYPEEGYKRALEILEERFGNPYNITCAWVNKVTCMTTVKGAAELRQYADELTCCIESLKEMGSLSQLGSGDNMIKIIGKLPLYLQNRWMKVNHDIRSKYRRGASVEELMKFVCDAAEEASDPVFGKLMNKELRREKFEVNKPQKRQSRSFAVNTALRDDKIPENKKRTNGRCPCCNQGHYVINCLQFKKLRVKDRWDMVKAKGLCCNCFAQGHIGKNCTSEHRCNVNGCSKKHSKYLHQSTRTSAMPPEAVPAYAPQVPQTTKQNLNATAVPWIPPKTMPDTNVNASISNFASTQGGRLALPIVPARVRCPDTNMVVNTYALLDPGTNTTYCTEELKEKLGAIGAERQIELTTIAQKRMPVKSTLVTLLVSDLEDRNKPHYINEVAVRPTLNLDLSGLASEVDLQKWPHLKKLTIPQLEVNQVHLLIGQDSADLLMPDEVRKGRPGEPYAVHTPLGWAINGPIDPFSPSMIMKSSHFARSTAVMERDLFKLWELEGANSEIQGKSPSDEKVVELWDNNQTVVNGHYSLQIPFKAETPCLPDNRILAERRLSLLQKRLERSEPLKNKYTEEIKKLIQKGYAEEVDPEDMDRADGKVWYLPHHPVHNPKKPEKMRIVFDCAARYRNLSLNDNVQQGPDLANKLVGVLLRFRQGPIAFIADIEAMFLQVKVPCDDRDVLRFLWFDDNIGGQCKTYRMTSHLFGGVWSPSCATYALQQVTREFKEIPQNVSNTILRNFYVDDCLKAVKNVDIAVPLLKQVMDFLARRGFCLTKVVSNSPELMSNIPKEKWGKSFTTLNVNLENLPTERALGLLWNIEEDTFGFDIQIPDKPKTKRGLLSTLSTVYDPLGYLSPFVLQARRLFQQLCRLKTGWDEFLPKDLEEQWGRWLNDLPVIRNFSIPRNILPQKKKINRARLHHFCDASEYGYGSVAYLRTEFADESVDINLMMTKSRLAPLKGSTIPRLELAGALEAVRLDKLLQEELELPLDESIYWTDSTIVLWYLQSTEKRFQTYVANRVAKILDHTKPEQWRHVPSNQNPGDDASRGMMAQELINSKRWKKGPSFLYKKETSWPKQPAFDIAELEKLTELKPSPVVYCITSEEDHTGKILNYYSDWHRLKKGVAWILRLRDILGKKPPRNGRLTMEELKNAEEAIIRYAQKGIVDGNKRQLDKLNPKKSASGLLLVGGRLTESKQEECNKHQYILPSQHPVSKLIVQHFHKKAGHPGVERVLADSRKRYWILKGRNLVKRIVHQCIHCRKLRARTEVQQMATLPSARVTPAEAPFTRVGVDYFGPFVVKRGRSELKRYGCIFTCLTIRAVHIELVHSLDTDSFINALERFIARRGEPKEIWSDNGTNFVGAQQELRRTLEQWNQDQIHEHLLKKEISWNFIPPGASHMGGVWERQIRTVRSVLAGVANLQSVDDETLTTLMTIVEGIINGRPITKLSDDPRDERPLTPNHLLLLRTGPTLPTGNFSSKDAYRRRWRQVQYLADIFWHRWTREYLPNLQERQKWWKSRPNLKKGDLVLVKQDNMPRNQWPLGLIIETNESVDGLVRSVKVRMKTGVYERPITKICVLESTAL